MVDTGALTGGRPARRPGVSQARRGTTCRRRSRPSSALASTGSSRAPRRARRCVGARTAVHAGIARSCRRRLDCPRHGARRAPAARSRPGEPALAGARVSVQARPDPGDGIRGLGPQPACRAAPEGRRGAGATGTQVATGVDVLGLLAHHWHAAEDEQTAMRTSARAGDRARRSGRSTRRSSATASCCRSSSGVDSARRWRSCCSSSGSRSTRAPVRRGE